MVAPPRLKPHTRAAAEVQPQQLAEALKVVGVAVAGVALFSVSTRRLSQKLRLEAAASRARGPGQLRTLTTHPLRTI
jgi:hypothetical protein